MPRAKRVVLRRVASVLECPALTQRSAGSIEQLSPRFVRRVERLAIDVLFVVEDQLLPTSERSAFPMDDATLL